MWNELAPHPHVVNKNSGGISWEQGVPDPHQVPQPTMPSQGHKFPQLLDVNQQGLSQWKKLQEPQTVTLKEPTHGLTYSDSFPLGSGSGMAA